MIARTGMSLLSAGLLLAVVLSCANDHDFGTNVNPRDPQTGGATPPVPAGVTLEVLNREFIVYWTLPDSATASQVSGYRIYRRTEGSSSISLADSSNSSPKTIKGIPNGQQNWISVSAVLKNGLEGERSNELSAIPGFYAVSIAEGSVATNRRVVRLDLTAPEGTQAVQIGSHSDLRDVGTRGFEPFVTWTLDEGDGGKSVYARFVNAQGHHSGTVSDEIVLDTYAVIEAFDFDGPELRQPGDVIVFTLVASEPEGFAEVELGRGGPRRPLRDDGIAPDSQASDGTYTASYTAEANVQFVAAEMIGRFIDQAGNEAQARSASRLLTVNAPPPALLMADPVSGGPTEITLRWSQAPEGTPFASYRLYRGESPGVDTLPTRRLIREFTSISQTNHTDSGVFPGRIYYYIVELVDPLGISTPSNEVAVASRPNEPPDPVILDPPFAVTENSVSLTWTRSFAGDFSAYRVLRGEQPNVLEDPQRRTLNEIFNPSETSYVDQNEVEEGKTYYYVVLVVDEIGETSASNEVTATIEDLFPNPVNLSSPEQPGETTIGLVWDESRDLDFQSYRIYRSEAPGVDETDQLAATVTEVERTRWLDGGLRENTEYYYRVFVVDRGGHATPSNEIAAATANSDPPGITLASPTEVTGALVSTIELDWAASSIHDFDSYRIYRDTAPAVGEDATLVRTIESQSTTTFRDEGLTDNRRYYYRVFVRDTADGSTGSNEREIVTANRAPTPVTLSVSATTTTSISLSWTTSSDADFLEYRLMRGSSPGSIATTVATFTRSQQTTYTDYLPGQNPNQDLFYKIVVYDDDLDGPGSLSADSNIVSERVDP